MQKPRYCSTLKSAGDPSGACGSFLSTQGSALLIVLCFVVLLTIVVAAFLAQSILHRQIFSARAGQTQVDVLASDAVEFMKADLRQEIISGSTNNASVYTVNGVPLYIPSTNLTIVPSRTGFVPGGFATNDPYANIIKISKYQTNFFSGPTSTTYNTNSATGFPPSTNASPSSTGDPSLNGRYIDSAGWTTNGWNKPQLIDSVAYPTATNNIPLPDWIYVTTNGRQVLQKPDATVVGRYAYVVYDEGGLLDINSAGCDASKMSPADAYDVARKGSLGFADLTQIPGINSTIQQAVVAWRNHMTSSGSYTTPATSYPTNAPTYLQYLVDPSLNKGFLKANPGDQRFLSRQDLIAYAPTLGLPPQSLAYLGTFSRTINAPTWTPNDVSTETLTLNGSPTTYAANAESGTWVGSGQPEPVYNRDIINVRWPGPGDVTITRPKLDDDTGTLTETITFHQGDPVVQHRFPLSKIALLSNPAAKTSSPTTPGTVAWAVLYYFGLKWSSAGDLAATSVATNPASTESHWEYNHCRNFLGGDGAAGGGTKYMNSIAQVAAITNDPVFKSREPDFFELLRAGTLVGSLPSNNVFDVGLSVIDQATPTDVPDLMCLAAGGASREWIGRKSLPYFAQMYFWPYRPTYDNKRDTIEAYLVPVLWNPYRNAIPSSTTVTNSRMYLFNSHSGNSVWATLSGPAVLTTNNFTQNPAQPPYLGTTPAYTDTAVPNPLPDPVTASASNYVISFSNSSDFSEPTILSSKYVTAPVPTDPNTGNPAGGLSESPNKRWGFFLGSALIPDKAVALLKGQNLTLIPPTWASDNNSNATLRGIIKTQPWQTSTSITLAGNQSGAGLSFRLQCQDTSTSPPSWRTYDEISVGALGASNFVKATDSAGAKVNITGAQFNASPCFSDAAGNDAYDYLGPYSFGPLDPRVNVNSGGANTRYGDSLLWNASVGGTVSVPTGATFRPSTTVALQAQTAPTPPNSVFTAGWGLPYAVSSSDYPGMSSENNPALPAPNFTYADSGSNASSTTSPIGAIVWNGSSGSVVVVTGDDVTRPADGFYGALPMAASQIQDRPIILNRPFLSVGELGYSFRSLEWRTLDFSSALSGDSGLLDLFSINDAENIDQQSMISGVVNINTRNPAVLQSIISGGLINGLDTSGAGITGGPSGDAQKIANAIVTETVGNRPLINRAELATRIVPLNAISGTATPTGVLVADGYVSKDRREALVRALAEPADTHTWNLLIDLVVQAGRYPPTAVSAGTLSQFDVQGERRYWLHIAIDRYTGKVIDEQLEVVHDN